MTVGTYRARSGTEIIDAAFQLVKSNYPALVTISALGFLPSLLAELIIPEAGGVGMGVGMTSLLLRIVGVFCSLLTQGALIRASSDAYQGIPPDIGRSLRDGLRHIRKLFSAGFIASFFIGLGFLLLIIPGLIVFAWLFVSPAVVMLEDKSNTKATSRSKELLSDSKLRVLSSCLVMIVAFLICIALVGVVAALTKSVMLVTTLSMVILALCWPIYPAFIVMHYYDARIRKEGYDVELTARALTPQFPAEPLTA